MLWLLLFLCLKSEGGSIEIISSFLSESDIMEKVIKREGGIMKLKALIEDLKVNEILGQMRDDMDVNSVTNDSRKVKEGSLFVAIKGYLDDGHLYLEKAKAMGAVAAVVTEFNETLDLVQIRVSNPREVLSSLSAKVTNHPTKSLRMVGITGTNGKTTTSYILDHIYQVAGYRTGLIGSVVIKMGDEFKHSDLTTPESSDLHVIFGEMLKKKLDKVVMEVSSSALELYRVHDVDFDIVAFNNFSREHIDQHGSLEKYYEAKASLIKGAKEGAFAVLNRDDEVSYGLKDQTKASVITFSTVNEEAHVYCRNLDLSSGRAEFILEITKDFPVLEGRVFKGQYKIKLKMPGFHSVVNSLSALTIALIDGVSIEDAIMGIETFSGVERRFQYIYDEDFIIIDDHFANASNIDMTLESLVKLKYKKLHLVYAIRGNRGPTVNRENIITLLKWKDKLGLEEIIGTRSEEFVTAKDRVTKEEMEVFKGELSKSNLKITLIDDLKPAIAYALDQAVPGDVILLAGSQGMDYGARVALDHIKETRHPIDLEKLYAPLKGRVSDRV